MMAVCEAPEGMIANANADDGTPQLVIRSYYQNSRTNERVWDEPPSGATNIIPAHDEVRRMANVQLEELHVVKSSKRKQDKNKKKSFVGRLFGSKNKKDKNKEKRRIEYKAGSKLYAEQAQQDTDDARIQEAIAASIAQNKGEPYVPSQQSAPHAHMENDEMAMAQALSMSAAEHENSETQRQEKQLKDVQTEDQILAQVMEQSKLEAKRGEGNLLDFTVNLEAGPAAASNPFNRPMSPMSTEDDCKMPSSAGPPATVIQQQMYQLQLQQQYQQQQQLQQLLQQQLKFPATTPASLPYASAPAGAKIPPAAAASAPNPSVQYAASASASAAASSAQYAAAMAAASSPPLAAAAPPTMKAPPSYAMAPTTATTSPTITTSYQNNTTATAPNMLPPAGTYAGLPPAAASTSPTYTPHPARTSSAAVPPIPITTSKPPPLPSAAVAGASPFTNTQPVLTSYRSSSMATPSPPPPAYSAMFDPYSKDAKQDSSKPAGVHPKAPHSSASTGLQKMDRSSDAQSNSRKMSIFKRKSASTKVQDKAGLV